MELFWFIALCLMLIVYILLDGFDFGAGVIYTFFTRDESERKLIHRAIGPYWDANEVWLIAAGGIMFMAFPLLYASAFSGFYLPLMVLLWLLIFRALGLELRHFVDHPLWHQFWDTAFGVASFLLALFYGLALGNVVRGVNLGGMEEGAALYDSNYFFLPLWNNRFSPLSERLGVVDWFTLELGFVALLALSIHGAAWIILKTEGVLAERLRKKIPVWAAALLALSLAALFVWQSIRPEALQNYRAMPVLWAFPLLMLAGGVGLLFSHRLRADWQPFFFSSLFIAGGLMATAVSMYPMLLPSANASHPDLTVFNAGLDEAGAQVAKVWFAIGIVLVVGYFSFLFRMFRGKLRG